MWYLKNAQGEITYLKPNKLMIVSRKEQNDIVLKNDTSISKLHASIIVRPKINFKENEPSSVVTIQDTESKYGTFIINSNNEQRKLTPGDHTLSVTDKIKFGLQKHVFTLHYVPLIASTSSLNANENAELKDIFNTLDGVIVDRWKEYCTHLTVSNVKLTSQTVQALAFGTQIVTLKYWRAVLQSVENNAKLPEVTNFVPSIEEGLINKESVSLKTNPERKVLFKNLSFVCFSSVQYRFKDIIQCAGGKLKLFQEGQTDAKQLSSENVIVLQIEADSSQPLTTSLASYNLIQKALQDKNRRVIPESEISLAILYCSTEKYCNPKFNFKNLLNVKKNSKNIVLSTTILAQDTQDILAHTSKKIPVIINETLTLSEQMEKSEKDSKEEKLRKPTNPNIAKESSHLRFGSKKNVTKTTIGSEESSREDCLVIDEAGLASGSDSTEKSVRGNFINETDEIMDQSEESSTTDRATSRRFNLEVKLPSEIRGKASLDNREARARNHPKKFEDNLASIPSTSKDMLWKRSMQTNKLAEAEESSPQKRFKISSTEKISGSANETVHRKSAKRNAKDGENMFSLVNEGAKRKKSDNETSGLFKLKLNENVRASKGENIFERALDQSKIVPKKRRRASSVSSDNAPSSPEEEKIKIKLEKPDSDSDSDSDEDHKSFLRIKKEDTSMNETYKSTTLPLLRKDVDLTMDNSLQSLKKFVKVYTSIPPVRIKMKNLYIWEPNIKAEPLKPREEESTSSEEEAEDDDFKFWNKKPTRKIKTRK